MMRYQEGLLEEGGVLRAFVDVQWYGWEAPSAKGIGERASEWDAVVVAVEALGPDCGIRIVSAQRPLWPDNQFLQGSFMYAVARPLQKVEATLRLCCQGSDKPHACVDSVLMEMRMRLEGKLATAIVPTRVTEQQCSLDGYNRSGSNIESGDSFYGKELTIEVYMGVCDEDDTETLIDCYADSEAALEVVLSNNTWVSNGSATDSTALGTVEVVSIEALSYPQLSELQNSHRHVSGAAWHLQAVSSRGPLLMGEEFDMQATGVNVYLLSTGLRATHTEFQGMGSSSGASTVVSGYGVGGLNPLQDCKDSGMWYGFGTFAASIITGRTTGVARNATLHSVRYRRDCLTDTLDAWSAGGLPSAMDSVLSTMRKPAIMVVDGWWAAGLLDAKQSPPEPPCRGVCPSDAAPVASVEEQLYDLYDERLKRAEELGVLVITKAGIGGHKQPCESVFANRSGTMMVGSVNAQYFRSANSAGDSRCIDIWAPGGDLGNGVLGAAATGDANYTDVVAPASVAMYLVAGVAAQYLAKHPHMSPPDLKRAIQRQSTKEQLYDIGPASYNWLLYSMSPHVQSDGNGTSDGAPGSSTTNGTDSSGDKNNGGGTAAWYLTVISFTCGVVGLLGGGLLGVVLYRRRVTHRVRGPGSGGAAPLASSKDSGQVHQSGQSALSCDQTHDSMSIAGVPTLPLWNAEASSDLRHERLVLKLGGSLRTSWLIDAGDITICRRPDGSDWVLGQGSYGTVFRSLKNGVQPVAVKVIARTDDGKQDAAFLREFEMMQMVCHDRNVVQFYGCAISRNNLALVAELMEGGDLRHALTSDASYELHWARRGKAIALDIVRGLVHLHNKKVIHRDLKSQNVLLTGDGTAKIGDIGMAQRAGLGQPAAGEAEYPTGTFAWAAPEVLMGMPCDEKVDIYSLGVCLWEIITQEVPIRGTLRDPDVPHDCPPEVADIIQMCMRQDPTQRPDAKSLYELLLRCPPVPGAPWVEQGDAPGLLREASFPLPTHHLALPAAVSGGVPGGQPMYFVLDSSGKLQLHSSDMMRSSDSMPAASIASNTGGHTPISGASDAGQLAAPEELGGDVQCGEMSPPKP